MNSTTIDNGTGALAGRIRCNDGQREATAICSTSCCNRPVFGTHPFCHACIHSLPPEMFAKLTQLQREIRTTPFFEDRRKATIAYRRYTSDCAVFVFDAKGRGDSHV